MLKLIKIMTFSGMLMVSNVYADTAGIFAGVGQWKLDPSGTVANGTDQVNLVTDLGLNKDNQNNYFVAIEHPLPFLPNFKIQRQEARVKGTNVITRTFTYSGQTFSANDTVVSDVDLGHNDIIMYYELLDNVVSLDLGLNVKNFDGTVDINSTTQSATDNLNAFVPMLYGHAKFEVPATNFAFDVEASVISYKGDSFSDVKAAVGYESDMGLGAELGYKSIKLNVNGLSGIDANTTFDGYYFDFNIHF